MRLPQIRTNTIARIEIPVQFSRLLDVAHNLWWSWTPQARQLFKMIDPFRWMRYRNPIEVLIDLEPDRWYDLQKDVRFIRAYRAVIAEFDNYLFPEVPTWFDREHPEHDGGPIVYFSTEFGWHECLQIYSGGLGILSGDHSKSASDMGLPFVGVGLMYRNGYFRQTLDADGNQQHFFPDYDLHRVPLLPVVDDRGDELVVILEFPERRVHVRVWKAGVGRIPVLLLDTDVPKNHPADRNITSVLYVSGREMRLCQELVLGFGGIEVLKALGIEPSVWHMNEGHSALMQLARMRGYLDEGQTDLAVPCRRVARNAIFTTHTPVSAGNECFDVSLVRKYLKGWSRRNGMEIEQVLALGKNGDGDGQFNMTALAMRTSSRTNGVSQLHGEVAGRMWNHLRPEGDKVEAITNGVHLPTWMGPDMGDTLRRHLGPGFEDRILDGKFAESVQQIPDAEIWRSHSLQKRRCIDLVRDRLRFQFSRHGRSPDELRALDQLLDPDMLLIGFARRFATYKRADLILRDFERLKRIVASDDLPVQFLFAGKAHPADRPGQELIKRIWNATLDPALKGRLLFLENYDMRVGRHMVQGVDLWLNTPRRPLEASGTSGMKVAMNGGLNCSILDGWWCEGYDPSHGWVIGEKDPPSDHGQQDAQDSDSLYNVITNEVAPCFYAHGEDGLPQQWIERMKLAMGALSPQFSTSRMIRDYTDRAYLAPLRSSKPTGVGSVE